MFTSSADCQTASIKALGSHWSEDARWPSSMAFCNFLLPSLISFLLHPVLLHSLCEEEVQRRMPRRLPSLQVEG